MTKAQTTKQTQAAPDVHPGLPSVVSCFRCGYDLRAHDADSACPECGASVAESIRLAPVPYRPAWQNADPRWRRRMIAGVWTLTLLPLMNLLLALDWAAAIPVPNIIDFHNTHYTLDQTFLSGFSGFGVFPLLVFCIGAVLLFSREPGRRIHRMDWTRRWGIGCSYITLLLGAASIAFITALVMTGIGACFISMEAVSMRARTQPAVTQFLIDVSYAYLHYGPAPRNMAAEMVMVSSSSCVMLLGCVPLFEALRSAGNKTLAWCLIAPLALFAVMHLLQVACYAVGLPAPVYRYEVYFWPDVLFSMFPASRLHWMMTPSSQFQLFVECTKWFIVLTIAVWLTIAQVTAWWYRPSDPGPHSSKTK